MKNLRMAICAVILSFLSCNKDKDIAQTILPTNVINVKVEPGNGFLKVDWLFLDNPDDSVLITLKDVNNQIQKKKFLVNDNSAIITGLSNQLYNITVATIDKNGDTSQSQNLQSQVLIPTYLYVSNSLAITPQLFGFRLAWKNPTSNLAIFNISYTDTSGTLVTVDTSLLSNNLNIDSTYLVLHNVKSGVNDVTVKISDPYSNGNFEEKKLNINILKEVDLLNYNSQGFYVSLTASSEEQPHSIYMIKDGDVNTYWESSLSQTNIGMPGGPENNVPSYTYPFSIDLYFTRNAKVARLELQPRVDENDGFTEFGVYYTNSEVSNELYKTFSLIQNGKLQSFDIDLPTSSIYGLSIRPTKGPKYYTTLAELKVYGYPLQ